MSVFLGFFFDNLIIFALIFVVASGLGQVGMFRLVVLPPGVFLSFPLGALECDSFAFTIAIICGHKPFAGKILCNDKRRRATLSK